VHGCISHSELAFLVATHGVEVSIARNKCCVVVSAGNVYNNQVVIKLGRSLITLLPMYTLLSLIFRLLLAVALLAKRVAAPRKQLGHFSKTLHLI
jgi:hypothetical protein